VFLIPAKPCHGLSAVESGSSKCGCSEKSEMSMEATAVVPLIAKNWEHTVEDVFERMRTN
jgi:hypothetical protein